MRPPSWWRKQHPPIWVRPLSKIYGFFASHSNDRAPVAVAPCPVISVGSLFMGGSGKTPVSMALARGMIHHKPIFITRGYKGRHKGPIWVDVTKHTAQDVGDEALLLAQHFPTIVSATRAHALDIMTFEKTTLLILDDGHQHTSLAKDLSLLVTTTEQYDANTWTFPAGPLREPWHSGMNRCDGLLTIESSFSKTPLHLGETQRLTNPPTRPSFTTQATFQCAIGSGQPVVGFCALGDPHRFHLTLQALFSQVKDFQSLPDHFFYQVSDEEALLQKAHQHGAHLVTTEKDWVKLSPTFRAHVHVVHQSLVLEKSFFQWVDALLLKGGCHTMEKI